jgi:hypothetical protein
MRLLLPAVLAVVLIHKWRFFKRINKPSPHRGQFYHNSAALSPAAVEPSNLFSAFSTPSAVRRARPNRLGKASPDSFVKVDGLDRRGYNLGSELANKGAI